MSSRRMSISYVDRFNTAYVSNPSRFEDVDELVDLEMQKRGYSSVPYSKITLISPLPLSGAGNPKSPFISVSLLPVSYNRIPLTPFTCPSPSLSNLTNVRRIFPSVMNSSA
jgi:hypothetical protein